MKWLKHLFPSLKQVRPEVVVDLPEWTLADAADLGRFLETKTGKRLIQRMRYDVTCAVLDPNEATINMRDEWRAISHVLDGIQSMADYEYWKYRDKEFLEREFLSEGTGFSGE